MSSLSRGIPSAFPDHRSGPGRLYMAICVPIAAAFGGTVPPHARPLLKAYGRLGVDVDRVNAELEAALGRRRMRDARRFRRQLAGMNRDLLTFTARLEELARAPRRPGGSLSDFLARGGNQ